MFIIDALIGNTDRHNENWGILVDTENNTASFAPIYDCESCLNPMLEDKDLRKLNKTEIKNLAINCYSCLKENNKKINYMQFIRDSKNEECNGAIVRIFQSINMDKINSFIENIYCISDVRKKFYKEIINYRYEIIKETYENLIK